MSKRVYTVIIVSTIIVCVSLLAWTAPWEGSEGTVELTISNKNGEEISVTIELADNAEERSKGLSGRESLGEKNGMLFVYEENVHHGFWMKNTYIPLSIAFISSSGKIIDIQDMEPLTLKSHKPPTPYRYTLEVNQGFFEEHEISENNSVTIPPEIR